MKIAPFAKLYKGMVLGVVALVLTASHATAQPVIDLTPNHWYFGGSFGMTSFDTGDVADITNVEVKGDDNSVNAFIGYSIGNNLGVEVFYTDLGQSAFDLIGELSVLRNQINNLTADLTSFGLAARVFAPFSNTARGFLKIGIHSWESTVEFTLVDDSTGTSNATSASVDGLDGFLGLGLEFDVNPSMAVMLGYDAYFSDVSNAYLGLRFNLP